MTRTYQRESASDAVRWRTGGKIIPFYKGDFQSTCNGIERDARASRAASNDQQVKLLLLRVPIPALP